MKEPDSGNVTLGAEADRSRHRVAVPDGFARPSPRYKLRVWVSVFGLLLFGVMYISLASWFSYSAYRMTRSAILGDAVFLSLASAIPSAFLALFLWKALFFRVPGRVQPGMEVTADSEPELIRFLNDLATELGAPRPHRVYLSAEVNAAVFYDLSLLNLIWPTRKNLVIGLGLVNALSRSEFRAVLAHEFGHFAQRSMAVGRWVYTAEQIAVQIVAKRDALDSFLVTISQIDLRVAWIGWIMRLIVWSIRSLVETVFGWVVLAERALSREMEFQADLVAVSATGSDALINSLYRIRSADQDWERSLQFADSQLAKQRVVEDLYAVQSRIGEHLRQVLGDPTRGLTPEIPISDAANFRVFSRQLAQPPRMWSTHPPNDEREANAKRLYLPSPPDERSAWSLFGDPQAVRRASTRQIFIDTNVLTGDDQSQLTPLDPAAAAAALDQQLEKESYDSRYQGAYLARELTLGHEHPDGLLGEPPPAKLIAETLRCCYPDSLRDSLAKWRGCCEEHALLQALDDGHYETSGELVDSDGNQLTRAQLPLYLAKLAQQRDHERDLIEAHDLLCRTAHQAAAVGLPNGWQDYHASLIRLLHYAEHSEADLIDAHGHLTNTASFATATGSVSSEKLNRVIDSANDLQRVMKRLDAQSSELQLPPNVLQELEVSEWRDAFPELSLPPAEPENVSAWMEAIESWFNPMSQRFGQLRRAVLDELLVTERQIADATLQRSEIATAPAVTAVPNKYGRRQRSTERRLQKRLDWWARFTLAVGVVPTILRVTVAATVLAAVIFSVRAMGNSTIVIYNGLGARVDVRIGNQSLELAPHAHQRVSVSSDFNQTVSATCDGESIEQFTPELSGGISTYVYNVGSASPLIQWWAVYGNRAERPAMELGAPRWLRVTAEQIFTPPPASLSSKSDGGYVSVLDAFSELQPDQLLELVEDPDQQQELLKSHVRWDPVDSSPFPFWLAYASADGITEEAVTARLRSDPDNVVLLRAQQDYSRADRRDEVCRRHRETAAAHPDDPDWSYVGIRAMPDGPEQDAAFLRAAKEAPHHLWLANAAGHVHMRRGNWKAALERFDVPLSEPGFVGDAAAIDVARIRRFIAGPDNADLADIAQRQGLKELLAIESGRGYEGTPMFAYGLLSGGMLEDAYRVAGGKSAAPDLAIMMAVSQDAPDEWLQQAMELQPTDIGGQQNLCYLAAAALRSGHDHERYLREFKRREREHAGAPQFTAAIENLFQHDVDDARPLDTDGLLPRESGIVAATAVIVAGDEAPQQWRKSARSLLFGSERPAL